MVKAEPWIPKTPMVKVEPFTPKNPWHRSPTRSPKVRLRLRKVIKSPHYLAAFNIKLKKSGGKLESPAICSTFLGPPALPATPSPEELTRIFKQHTPKSVKVTQDMLWEANVELQQQVNDLNKELNDLNEELITSQQEVLQLDTTLMRCREAHEKTVAEQVALMFRDLEFD